MPKKVTREELIAEINELASKTDGAPTSTKMREDGEFSVPTYYNHFESWNAALKEAGFDPNHQKKESIVKECEICGSEMELVPSNKEQRFCSHECFGEYRKGMYTGQEHPNYAEKTTVKCDNCGSELERKQWRLEYYNRHYCDRECQSEWMEENYTKEGNPRWRERVTVECEYCGSELKRQQFLVEKGQEHFFCDIECENSWQSKHYRGEKNPNWKGGALQYEMYGPNWFEIRREVIQDQNGKCRVCTTHRDDLDRDLHVHHIIPLREFQSDSGEKIDWRRANQKYNLVALCQTCHQEWEGHPVLPNNLGKND